MTGRLDWAIYYATMGWPVLALHSTSADGCSCGQATCASPGKHPRLRHGLKEATKDIATVGAWWERWPDANIGIRTGDIFDVLDIDGADGLAAIDEAVAEHGPLPDGPRALTGGGGRHLLFAPTGIGNRAALLTHVDWRGRNGYIVAPPSRHISGVLYEWDQTPDVCLEPVPPWLAALLDPPKPKRQPAAATGGAGAGDNNAYVQRALDGELGELARAPEGMRNHQLNIAAFNLYQLVGGGELSGDLVEGELRRTAQMIGLDGREIEATIGSGRRSGLDRPRTAPPRPVRLQSPPAGRVNGSGPDGPPPPGDADAPPLEVPRRTLTDAGNADRFIDTHGDDTRHVKTWTSWLCWDGHRWQRDDTGAVIEKAKLVARAIYTEAAMAEEAAERKRLVGWARQSENAGRIHSMVGLAGSDPKVATRPDDLDSDRWLLTVANGTLDLAAGELRPHRRDDRITKLADVAYDPAATCPVWGRFLEQVLPDPAVRAFLRRAVGYALTGSVREQCLFFLYGLGANGKSTLITTLLRLLGDYGRQADPRLLMESKHETHPTNVADLQGARFVATIEAGAGRRLDETLVKQLTGGDRLKARFMRQDFFEFDPTHKLFLAANHKPVIRGNDHAIWRRVHLIPFNVTIPRDQRQDDLGEWLLGELPGILRWAVEGCLEWQSDGLQVPAEVAEATDAYRAEEDLLGDFLTASCKEEDGGLSSATELYKAYQRWTEETGEKPWSQTAFGRALGERGFDATRDGRGRKVRRGLVLLSQQDQQQAFTDPDNCPNRPTASNSLAPRTVSDGRTFPAYAHTHKEGERENSPSSSELFGADSDPCGSCGAPATGYAPDGAPYCDQHPPGTELEP